MIGVKFNRAMRPYGAGDTAILPEDIAQRVVDAGEAELYEFPAAPFANDANASILAPRPIVRPKQNYVTKKGR